MWDSEIPLQGQYSLSKTRLLVKFHYPTLVRINGSMSLICTFWGGGVIQDIALPLLLLPTSKSIFSYFHSKHFPEYQKK